MTLIDGSNPSRLYEGSALIFRMITTDDLFTENFKPAWLKRQQAQARASLDETVRAVADYGWELEARRSRERIAKRVGKHSLYNNPQ